MRRLLLVPLLGVAAGLAWSGPRFDARWVRSPVLRNSEPFQAAGVYWRDPSASTIRVRASTDGANWTPWMTAQGEQLEDGRIASGLLYFGEGFRFLEVDGLRDLPDVLLIDPGTSARVQAANVDPAAPPIVTREQWGCTPQTCPAKDPPVYTKVTHLIVHHTDNVNNATDWAAVVRSIWVLHVQGNGWNDIGYNYLIDPSGLLYEGRAGGDGVLGAHFSGVNSGTMGVALLGTYIDQMPSPDMRDMLARMLAWQAGKWTLDPSGVALHAASGLTLNVISGHRDANLSPKASGTTECPGNTAYSLLPGLRADVASRLPGCFRLLGERNRCISAQGGEVLVPAACDTQVSIPAGADWITADTAASAIRLLVAPNSKDRRSALVSLGGQNIAITQASLAEQTVSCIAQRGIVNSADFDQRPVAPGSLVTLFGENFNAGTSVSLNGKPVTVEYAGTNQINVLLPMATAIGTNYFTATTNGIAGPQAGFAVTEAMPAVFIAVNADDNTVNSSAQPVKPGRPLVLYLTGAGTARYPWSVTIGDIAAVGLFLGPAPGFPGLNQANIVVPAALAPGDYSLLLKINGVTAGAVTVAVGF